MIEKGFDKEEKLNILLLKLYKINLINLLDVMQ